MRGNLSDIEVLPAIENPTRAVRRLHAHDTHRPVSLDFPLELNGRLGLIATGSTHQHSDPPSCCTQHDKEKEGMSVIC